ncbi:hypothetical protein L9F63_013564, partial [Diploptera punctata]
YEGRSPVNTSKEDINRTNSAIKWRKIGMLQEKNKTKKNIKKRMKGEEVSSINALYSDMRVNEWSQRS